MALIELKEISMLYGLGNTTNLALDEINLEIEDGEFVAVMGPSGSGKSTLMHVIGLLDTPTHGRYTFSGRNAATMPAYRRAKIRRDRIGFIFQSYNLLPRLNAIENVALPMSYRGASVRRQIRRAGELLDRVGLADHAYYYPRQMSGGQIQCVAIARALVNKPELIIADEPTGNLDTNGSRLVMELLSEIHRSGNTVLFVTHNPELTRYATRVVYMRDGMVIHDEKTAIGEVAKTAKKQMYNISKKSALEDVAGVSELMKIRKLPGDEAETISKKTKKAAKKNRKSTKKSKVGAKK